MFPPSRAAAPLWAVLLCLLLLCVVEVRVKKNFFCVKLICMRFSFFKGRSLRVLEAGGQILWVVMYVTKVVLYWWNAFVFFPCVQWTCSKWSPSPTTPATAAAGTVPATRRPSATRGVGPTLAPAPLGSESAASVSFRQCLRFTYGILKIISFFFQFPLAVAQLPGKIAPTSPVRAQLLEVARYFMNLLCCALISLSQCSLSG